MQPLEVARVRGVPTHEQNPGAEPPLHLVYRAVDEPPLHLRLVRRVQDDVVPFPLVLLLQPVLLLIERLLRGNVGPPLVIRARIEQASDDRLVDRGHVQTEDAARGVDDPVRGEAVLRTLFVHDVDLERGRPIDLEPRPSAVPDRRVDVPGLAVSVVAVAPRRLERLELRLRDLLQRLPRDAEVYPHAFLALLLPVALRRRRGGE
mmetsp:Transcript_2282/g.7376  ORF Transcript_2282/g.7376 Transcript_2282/m.7376 type:complete len:205 (-) Transcript_2282:136-750(-)